MELFLPLQLTLQEQQQRRRVGSAGWLLSGTGKGMGWGMVRRQRWVVGLWVGLVWVGRRPRDQEEEE